MRILFIGDIVGRPGVRMVEKTIPALRPARGIDVVIANAENATNGAGCSPADFRRIRAAGVDLVTLGDHIFKKAEIISVLESDAAICKPANFSTRAPGRDYAFADVGGSGVAVISLLGRTFMRPADCPFQAADRVLAQIGSSASVIVVDVHAEATADKYLLGHYLTGRVSAVVGTHTHVQTADEHIFAGKTGFICDVGMCGPYASILGRKVERVLDVAVTGVPSPFEVADGDVRLGGAILEVDVTTGRATKIERIMIGDVAN